MSTVRQFLQEQLEGMGVYGAGETMSAADATRGLSIFTNLIKSWNIQGLLIPAVTRETLTLTSGQSSRTIGATGQLVTARPIRIEHAAIKIDDVEYPLEILTPSEWAMIADKTLTGRPSQIYIEGTYPNDTINFFPVPDSNYSFVVQSLKPIVGTLTLDTNLSFPDGYEWSLGCNFRILAGSFWGKQPDIITLEEARDSKSRLMLQNSEPVYFESDGPGVMRKPYDINIGE